MSGIANPNYATSYVNPALKRSAEVTGADWDGGMNPSGSCSPGIGINTGDYSPKASDWSQHERDPVNGQHLGKAATVIQVTPDGNDNASFVQAIADTAPDAQVGTTGVYNRTGKTVPNGAWFWGHKPVA